LAPPTFSYPPEHRFPLAKRRISTNPYITDVAYQPENAAHIVALAAAADLLFIEAPFLAADTERAAQNYHLTAHQAGCLARTAGVKTVIPFHFSPRCNGREAELRDEVAAAFAGTGAPR
jgi:Metal-dependent hydrolases of the beta-lactamase superfamily III